jgi:hypothetical protein
MPKKNLNPLVIATVKAVRTKYIPKGLVKKAFKKADRADSGVLTAITSSVLP